MTVLPLTLASGSELAAVANTSPRTAVAHHKAAKAPKQRWDEASQQEHIKAGKPNTTVPASQRSRFPLQKAPATAKVKPNTARIATSPTVVEEAQNGAVKKGFDAAASTELPARRTADQRVYQNPDGSLTTEFSAVPINYQRADGSWTPIDTTLRKESGFTITAGPAAVSFATQADSSDLATVSLDARHSLSYRLRGAASATGTAKGSQVRYENIQSDADLELVATGQGAKETIVLKSAHAPSQYVFDLHLKGLTARLSGRNVVLSDAAGTERARIPAGFMLDAGTAARAPTRSEGVTYRLIGSAEAPALEVTLDRTWLQSPDRAFPVQVDPSVQLPVQTGGASSGMTVHGSSSSKGDQELLVGYQGGSNSAAYVKFNGLVDALQYHTIFGAQLSVVGFDAPSCKARPLGVYPVTDSWTAGTGYSYPGPSVGAKLDSATFAYGYIATGKSSTACPAQQTAFDLGTAGQKLIQGWVDGTKANNGLSLRAAAGDASAWKKLAGTDTANAPKLFVTHSPYNASYKIANPVPKPTVLANQDGFVNVAVTNKGAESWAPGKYYLAYRVYDAITNKAGPQVRSAELTSTVARGGKVTLNAKIKRLPVGTYLLDFTMMASNGKVFTDYQVPPARVVLGVYNVPPVLKNLYPDNGYEAGTLTPQLWAQATDVDAAASTLTYKFTICEAVPAGTTQPACTVRDYSSKTTWTPPTGTLSWSKTYKWQAEVKDSQGAVSTEGYVNLLTSVPQPAVTSKVGGAPYADQGQEFDPQIGNLTTAAIEAPVITTGPALNVQRTYNSLDPRRTGAFGAGWTTKYDMRVTPEGDGSTNPLPAAAVISYPDGQEVRFGRNPDGTFVAPTGRIAGLALDASTGVWTLTDRGGSKYTFSNTGRLMRITDGFGRSLLLTYDTSAHLSKVQASNDTAANPSGRALTFTWTGSHVASVSTDPVNGSPLTWNYTYDGDLLKTACAPGSICTTYDYTGGSHYRTAVLDDRPESYYRLGDSDDPAASSEVAVNLGKDVGTYTAATLGAAGAINGSPDTAVTLNGSTSTVSLPKGSLKRNRDQAVELWFKTPAGGTGGPLLGYQDKDLSATSTLGVPAMYVGTDGKLRAQFATGTFTPITSTALVNDGGWHHAVLSASGSTQTLFLDGSQVGTLSGTISHDTLTVNQAGAAYATTPASWPMWGAAAKRFFTGSIDEVAFYNRPLVATAVSAHYDFGKNAADQLTTVTLPSGKVASETSYDVDTDRVSSYTDRHGGTWKVGAPMVYGGDTDLRRSIQVRDPAGRPYLYEFDALAGRILRSGMPTGLAMREEDAPTPAPTDPTDPDNCPEPDPGDPVFCTLVPGDATGPVFYTLDGLSVRTYGYDDNGNQNVITDENGNVTTLGFDARGNATTHRVCRTSTTDCYTDYSTYPATVTNPFDPRNDLVTETRDGRSSSAADNTYLTTYTYGLGGNLTKQTNPDGGVVKHTYSTGAELSADATGTIPTGVLLSTTDALGAVTKFSYFANGDLATVTEASKLTTTYAYDALGRKISEKEVSDAYPSPGVVTSFGYDANSRMSTMTEPATADAVSGTKHQRKTVYRYDDDGNVLATEVADLAGGDALRRTTFEYDDHNNVSASTDAEGNETSYGYDRFANMTSMLDVNDRRYEYGYTARNTLAETRLRNWNGDPDEAPSTSDYLVLHSYTFDLGGRMLSDTDAMGRRLEYTYNLDNTLRQLTLKDFHNPDGSTRDIVVEADTYDGAGNTTQQVAGNGQLVTQHTYTPTGQIATTTVNPGGINRKTAFTYDLNGNVTRSASSGNFSNVTWPVFTTTDTVEFTYNTLGQQVQQSVSDGTSTRVTTATYDQRGLVTSTTDPRGNVSGATAADYTTTYTYDELGRRIKATAPAVNAESKGQPATSIHPTALIGFNTFDDQVASKDPLGNVSTATVDRLGRETSQTGTPYTPPGSTTAITPVTHTQYDAIGNVIQNTDASNNVTRYGYDRLDRLVTKDEPTTNNDTRAVWRYTYGRTGEVLSVTDPKGGRVESTYDDLDRPITTTQVERSPSTDNFTTKYSYDDVGNLLSTTAPSGAVSSNTYDPIGQLLTSTDPSGVVTKHGYDSAGREVRLSDGLGRTSRTDYNGFGQVASESDISPANATVRTQSYKYDPAGNLTSAINPLKTERTYTYDALGQLTQQTEPVTATKSITTSFGYDASGNRTRYTDGRGNKTISTVNSWGLPESVIEPSTTAHPNDADRTWTMAYDTDGDPVKLTAPGGVSRTRTFDAAGRLTQETGSGAKVPTVARTLGYDSLGQLTSASAGTDGSGTNTYQYNDRGLITAATGPSGTASFSYDGDGNLTDRTDAAGTATFGYVKGRLSTEKDGVTAATQTLDYDAAGALKSIDYGAGRVRTFGYDDLGHQTTDTLKNNANTIIASIAYGYDLDDRMTSKTTTGTAGAAANTYGYDQAGRLTSWTKGGSTVNYAWDDSGNRTQAGTKTASYDARNRLMSDSDYTYSYSANGTMAGRTSSGATEPFSFDAFDRLISQGSVTYTYDGLDRLSTQAGATFQYAGPDDNIISDGTETYARGAYDELLAIARGTTKRTTLSDQHDDLFAAFDTTNTSLTALDDSAAYDPFGQVLDTAGTDHNVGYQGSWTDPSTGEVNMGARWYTPGTGAFISQDSVQYASGPSILANQYTYAAGDPMDYNDPDGNWPSCGWCKKAASAVSRGYHAVTGAVRSAASYVVRSVTTVARYAWSAIKAVGRTIASAARAVYHKAKAAVSYVRQKLASAANWVANRAAAAASWARAKAEAARKAAIAHARAVTAKAKQAVAYAVAHNPLPVIKAMLKPVIAAGKRAVSAIASLPAIVVSATKDVIVDAAKATQAIYQKAIDKAGVVIDELSTAASAAGEFVQGAIPMIAGIAAGLATTAACMAVTGGAGTPACIVAGFAVGGAVTSALSCAPGRSKLGCAARGAAAGTVAGVVTVATGGAAAEAGLATMIASGAASGAAGDAATQYLETGNVDLQEVATAAVLGGVTGGIGRGRGCNSFAPETRVLMADGSTKAIEDVQVGDQVLATDPTTGKTSARPVTDVIVGSGEKHLVRLTLDIDGQHGQTIETVTATDGHPFWVDGNGEQLSEKDDKSGHWSDAEDLRTGDRLHTPSGGGSVAVLDTSSRTELRTVYNLTVDGVHTYYIQTGDTDVLVHNARKCKVPSARAAAKKEAAKVRSKGETPTAVSAAVDRTTGKVYPGKSGELTKAPDNLADLLPNPSLEKWGSFNCAEVAACSKALKDGAKLSDLDVATVHTKNDQPFPKCKNCENWVP